MEWSFIFLISLYLNVSKLIERNIICFIDFFIEVPKISFVLS